MSTTPQKMLSWVLLPKISLRQMLTWVVISAGLMWTYLRAMEEEPWAIAVMIAAGFAVAFFSLGFFMALVAWIPSRVLAGNHFKRTANPFADGQLPPVMAAAPREQKL